MLLIGITVQDPRVQDLISYRLKQVTFSKRNSKNYLATLRLNIVSRPGFVNGVIEPLACKRGCQPYSSYPVRTAC